METNVATREDRLAAVQAAIENGTVFTGGLNFPVGRYEFRLLSDDNVFSTRNIVTRKGNDMTLFLVRGEVKTAENIAVKDKPAITKGRIMDKGHRTVSVDVPELWADMRQEIVYTFEVEEYTTERDKDDGTTEEVIRKRAVNWSATE